MLHEDTDLFDKFPEWITFGDLTPTFEWEESPSADERYTVRATWRFRSEVIGNMTVLIYPTVRGDALVGYPDTYTFEWIELFLRPAWQRKGIYTTLLKTFMDKLLPYGVGEFIASPLDRSAEGIFKLSGWEWTPKGFVIDLESERLREWREYVDGGDMPPWRRAVLDEYSMTDENF